LASFHDFSCYFLRVNSTYKEENMMTYALLYLQKLDHKHNFIKGGIELNMYVTGV
jgi:hypothetical protein